MKERGEFPQGMRRLWTAVALLSRQQLERMALGGRDEYDAVSDETREIADEVVEVIERGLDEDLVEQLNREEGTMETGFGPWSFWPPMIPNPMDMMMSGGTTTSPRRRREEALIEQVVAHFRAELLADYRDARRDDRDLTEAEIEDRISDLRDQLEVIITHTHRRRRRRATVEVASDL